MTAQKIPIDSIIRIGLIALIVIWSITILKPFLVVLLWGIIIAVSAYPGYLWLVSKLGDRPVVAASLIVLLLLLLLIIGPIVGSLPSFAGSIRSLVEQVQAGTLEIPEASEAIRQWPLVGESLYVLWQQAATNLTELLVKFQPQLKDASVTVLQSITAASLGILQFIVATFIAGIILVNHARVARLASQFLHRIAPESRDRFLDLCGNTVRGVTMGVVGVAIVQSILVGIGFVVIGIPAAALWAAIFLMLAIVQISVGLVVIPIVIYVFFNYELLPAVLFLAWNLPVMSPDNVLKPLLMGRGVDAPMLVVFIGSIGGFIGFGFLGLFFGAVILVIANALLLDWLEDKAPPETLETEPAEQ